MRVLGVWGRVCIYRRPPSTPRCPARTPAHACTLTASHLNIFIFVYMCMSHIYGPRTCLTLIWHKFYRYIYIYICLRHTYMGHVCESNRSAIYMGHIWATYGPGCERPFASAGRRTFSPLPVDVVVVWEKQCIARQGKAMQGRAKQCNAM